MVVNFVNKIFKRITIERKDNNFFSFKGQKLAGEHFEYEDGDSDINLYYLQSEELAIEFRLTDSSDHIHMLIKFKNPKDTERFIEWMRKDVYRTKAKLKALLQ